MLWIWFSYCFEGVHREVASAPTPRYSSMLSLWPTCTIRARRRSGSELWCATPRESLHFRPHPLVWLLQTPMRR
jgi:hypothetical protein